MSAVLTGERAGKSKAKSTKLYAQFSEPFGRGLAAPADTTLQSAIDVAVIWLSRFRWSGVGSCGCRLVTAEAQRGLTPSASISTFFWRLSTFNMTGPFRGEKAGSRSVDLLDLLDVRLSRPTWRPAT